jgi:hypothetical protein
VPLLALLNILLIVACGVHVVRTGRPYWWIILIVMAPFIGGLIYFFAEILPELLGSRTARKVAGDISQIVDPDRRLRELIDQLQLSETAENKRALAEEYLGRGNAPEAERLLKSALTGVHADDPHILYALARAQFALAQHAEAIATLDLAKERNPEFRSADAHLLYARALEECGRISEAREEYEAVQSYFPGAEARCRLAMFLEKQGESARARVLFEDIVRAYRRVHRTIVQSEREWYEIAKQRVE